MYIKGNISLVPKRKCCGCGKKLLFRKFIKIMVYNRLIKKSMSTYSCIKCWNEKYSEVIKNENIKY